MLQSGQASIVKNARVAGIVSCVPSKQISNEAFHEQFGDGVEEVTKMTGVRLRHWVDDNTTTSDLCCEAGKRLLDGLGWTADSVDAILFISQTPDYRLPATAISLQARLGMRTGTIAFDVNLGCSAYPYGLWLAMMMVENGAASRVLLAVGDTSSRVVDPGDRATALLFGDAGTVTAIEAGSDGTKTSFILGSDGRGANNLIIPQGAFRTAETASPNDPEKLFMDGGEVFAFTLKAVPQLFRDTMALSETPAEDYDGFLFHQANTFMIKHLAKKCKLPSDKVPINIDKYGNTSSATIPLLLTDQYGSRLQNEELRLAFFGFGVGYSWSSASLLMGPLKFIETITL